MDEIIQLLSTDLFQRALITSSMVGLMCGILGTFLVLRNMSLIGDALSHSVLPGIFFAFVVVQSYSSIAFFIGSSIAGLVAALSISWIQQNMTTKNDAAIGIVYTTLFSVGVIGISWLQHSEGVHIDLKDFLFGNVLGISNEDIYLTFAVMLFTIISVSLFYRHLLVSTFQETIAQTMGIPVRFLHYFLLLMLSFVVVASLQAVGVILVVAMLVTPASTALLLSNKMRNVIFISAFLGLLAAILGLIASIVFDFPPGPTMAVVSALMYFLAVLFSSEHGIIFKFLRERKESNRIEMEDIIKYLFKNKGALKNDVAAYVGLTANKVNSLLGTLMKNGYVQRSSGQALLLTEEGDNQANKLIRAHRLWETYQVEAMGMDASKIHPDAERMEHHLSRDLMDKISKDLGHPDTDPHGSPIPPKKV